MIYLIILFLILLLVYHYDFSGGKSHKKQWYISILIILICVAGLRYRIGVDSIRYEAIYPQFPTVFQLLDYDYSSTRYGVGYIIFSSLARTISDDFIALQFLQAIFINTVIFWFFYRYSTRPFFCILIYYLVLYFNFNFEVMREACAVSSLLLAWPFFIEKKWIKYYLLAILCCLFHTGGIIVIILPIVYKFFYKPLLKINLRAILVLIVFYLVGIFISAKFFDYLQLIAIVDGIQDGIDMYATSKLGGSTLNIGGVISTAIKYILFPFIGVWLMKRLNLTIGSSKSSNVVFQGFEFMTMMCFIVAILSIPITIFYRYTSYFFPFAIMMMCEWLFRIIPYRKFKIKLSFGMYMLILSPFFLWQIYGLVRINPEHHMREIYRYYPYASRIEKSVSQNREKLFNFYNL